MAARKKLLPIKGFEGRSEMTGEARRKLFRSFLVGCLIPALLVSLIGGSLIMSGRLEQNRRRGEALLDRAEGRFSEILGGLEQLSSNLSYLSWVQQMMRRQGDYSRYQMRIFSKDLSVYRNSHEFITFAGIYFKDRQVAITSDGIMDRGFFDGTEVSVDGLPPLSWLAEHPLKNQQLALFITDFKVYASETSGVLCIKPLSINIAETDSRAILFLYMPQQGLNHAMAQFLPSPQADLCLLENSGRLVFSTQGLPASHYSPLLSQDTQNFRWADYCVQAKMVPSGYRLMLLTPKEEFYSGLFAVLLLIFAFLMVVAVFGFLLAGQLSRKNYQPLGNLVSWLRQFSQSQDEEQDEYGYLQKAITDMAAENQSYSQKLVFTEEQVLTADLLKIFSGIPVPAEAFAAVKAHFPRPLFCCVSVKERTVEDLQLSKERIKDFEDILRYLEIDFFSTGAPADEYLLNFGEESQLLRLKQTLLAEQERFQPVFFSFGDCRSGAEQLGEAYKEMKTAEKYRRLAIGSSVSCYADTAKNDFYYYPISDEFQLTAYIHAGDADKALALLEQLYRRNLALEAASRYGIRNFFCDLILTLTKAAREAALPLPPALEQYLDSAVSHPEEAFAAAADFTQRLAESFEESRRGFSEDRGRQILDFVNQTLCSPDLSLQYVADQFQISASYVSGLFKEVTGENFVDYINFHRIERVKRLLLGSRQDIVSISQQCGFLNDSTCRRLFKKYTGLSPSQYRREKQKE